MLKKENSIAFLLCFFLLFSVGYLLMIYFDIDHSYDPKTYWHLAHFQVDQDALRRKYRIIIPLVASFVSKVIVSIAGIGGHKILQGDFAMRFSFFIINTSITALWCSGIYRFCRTYVKSYVSCSIGTLAVLSSAYTYIMAATPLVDSLYCLVCLLVLLGIRLRKDSYLVWAIFLGPFAKESFIFVAPVIFFFSHIPKKKSLFYFLLSGLIVFSFRYMYDQYFSQQPQSAYKDYFSLFSEVGEIIRQMFTIAQANFLVSTFGLWPLIPLIGFFKIKGYGKRILYHKEWYLYAYLVCVLIQLVIHGEVFRMLYLGMPVWALVISSTVDMFQQKSFANKRTYLTANLTELEKAID